MNTLFSGWGECMGHMWKLTTGLAWDALCFLLKCPWCSEKHKTLHQHWWRSRGNFHRVWCQWSYWRKPPLPPQKYLFHLLIPTWNRQDDPKRRLTYLLSAQTQDYHSLKSDHCSPSAKELGSRRTRTGSHETSPTASVHLFNMNTKITSPGTASPRTAQSGRRMHATLRDGYSLRKRSSAQEPWSRSGPDPLGE